MKEFAKKVKLLEFTDVEKIAIRKDLYFSNAYAVDLSLETVPDHVWQDLFEQAWKSSRHLWDRKLFVVGDKLRLVTTVDDINEKIDWVKDIVEKTNRDIEQYNQDEEARELQTKDEMQRQAIDEEKANVGVIRDALRRKSGLI